MIVVIVWGANIERCCHRWSSQQQQITITAQGWNAMLNHTNLCTTGMDTARRAAWSGTKHAGAARNGRGRWVKGFLSFMGSKRQRFAHSNHIFVAHPTAFPRTETCPKILNRIAILMSWLWPTVRMYLKLGLNITADLSKLPQTFRFGSVLFSWDSVYCICCVVRIDWRIGLRVRRFALVCFAAGNVWSRGWANVSHWTDRDDVTFHAWRWNMRSPTGEPFGVYRVFRRTHDETDGPTKEEGCPPASSSKVTRTLYETLWFGYTLFTAICLWFERREPLWTLGVGLVNLSFCFLFLCQAFPCKGTRRGVRGTGADNGHRIPGSEPGAVTSAGCLATERRNRKRRNVLSYTAGGVGQDAWAWSATDSPQFLGRLVSQSELTN